MTTNNIVSTPNITGNIGSCEIKTSSMSVSSFYTQTMAVNSCTGEIVSQQTYYDYSYVYFPLVIIVMAILIFGTFRVIFD